MKSLLLLITFACVFTLVHTQTQTYWTDIFLYLDQDARVKEGAFKMMFEIPGDMNHTCYKTFNMMRVYSWDIEGFTSFWVFPRAIEEYLNLMVLFYEFYDKCGLNNVAVTLGRRFNSFSGFVEFIVNTIFRGFEMFGN